MNRLAGCLERGLAAVAGELEAVAAEVQVVTQIAACLEGPAEQSQERAQRFEELLGQLQDTAGAFAQHAARMMVDWQEGLFAGSGVGLPLDNLGLERFFKLPKRHARCIHGRAHAGIRLVQEGPTLLPTLNAHELHPAPFLAEDLLSYRQARPPSCQQEAMHRRKLMRNARSAKQRPQLLAELENRYQNVR